MIHHYNNIEPNIHPSAFIAKDATIIGDVDIGEKSSVWFKTVIRGDVDQTRIGRCVNIQDLSMIHQSPGLPVIIEDDVSIGHKVTIHGCKIQENALIGMGAIVLDGAEIGKKAIVGAGSIVTPGTKIPSYTLALGSPARVVRELTEKDLKELRRIKQAYVDRGRYYLKETKLYQTF